MARLARAGRYTLAAVLAGATIAACDSGVFDVEDPQAFGNEDLDDPAILRNVADGAEGLLHQAYDDYIVITELLGDAIESSSTWIDWEDISEGRLRADWATEGSFAGPQNNLLRARYAAQDAAARFERVLGDSASRTPIYVQVKAVDAWADLLLGQGFCEGPLVADGPREPDTKFYEQAVTKFTAALPLAQGLASAADKDEWVNTILAGRARANLFAGSYDAALADAQAVSAGFVKNAVYSGGSGAQQSWTGHQLHQNRNRSGGLRRLYHDRVHVIGGDNGEAYLRDWFDPSVDDPRMEVTRFPNQLGVNNRIQYYGITKYNDYGADIVMTSKREMNLIEAEVYMRKGDFATMTDRLNRNRQAAGLPAMTVPADAAAAQAALLSERFAELFVEGHRMNDLYRFDLVGQILGPGRAMKLPLSRTEILNNSSMVQGEGQCPRLSS
jgi:hypothetical protein